MKTLNENQMGLLRRLERFYWARPGQVQCTGYSHPIGASNGLKGIVNAGFASWRWSAAPRGGNPKPEYQINDAGRALLHPVKTPATT